MRTRRSAIPVVAVLCAMLLVGCVGTGGAPSDPRSGGGLKYGLAPAADQGTTFRKDVVLVGGGASSVRSVTADGFTWTVAPDAPGLGDLKLGRVMFLTDRAVGKVVAIHTTDKGVDVTLAPVTLTDVIEKGSYSRKNVPLADPIVVSGDGALWSDPDLLAQAGVDPGAAVGIPQTASYRSDSPGPLTRVPAPPAAVADVKKYQSGSFALTDRCCSSGSGVDFSYKKDRLSMNGRVGLLMKAPRADFDLKIDGATLKRAHLTISGAAGIETEVHAKVEPGSSVQGKSPALAKEISFVVPLDRFFGVPLQMVVTQRFTVEVNIPGTATLDGYAKVKIGGEFGFHYDGGGLKKVVGTTFDRTASLKGTNSLAVGISWVAFDYNVRFTVGLGYLGFVAGAFFALGVHTMSTVGAPIGFNPLPGADSPIEHCVSVQASVWTDYGVGYSIPDYALQVANFFLKAFQSQPIKKDGGLSAGWQPQLNAFAVFPQSGFCT